MLSTAEIAEFWRDGVVVIDDVLDDDEVRRLREATESPEVSAALQAAGYSEMGVHLLSVTTMHAAFRALASSPALVERVSALIGPDIQLQHSKLATKPPVEGKGAFRVASGLRFLPAHQHRPRRRDGDARRRHRRKRVHVSCRRQPPLWSRRPLHRWLLHRLLPGGSVECRRASGPGDAACRWDQHPPLPRFTLIAAQSLRTSPPWRRLRSTAARMRTSSPTPYFPIPAGRSKVRTAPRPVASRGFGACRVGPIGATARPGRT